MSLPDMIALADAFAEAAFDRSRWLPALQLLADLTRSSHGQLIGIGGPAAIPFNWVTGFPERALREFVEINGGSPEVNPRVYTSERAGLLEVVSEAQYREAERHLTTDVYLDFSRDHRIENGCQARLFEASSGIIGLATLRGAADGPTSPEERVLFAEAARHARGAVRIGMALEADAASYLTGALDSVSAAAFVCDLEGKVESMTPAAEQLLSSGRLLLIGKHLTAGHPAEASMLAEAMEGLSGGRGIPRTVALAARPGAPLFVLNIAVIPPGRSGLFSHPRLLVLVRTGRGDMTEAARLLNIVYGLTEAEAVVATLVAMGEARETIAAQRGVSLATVRSQLKTIFAKLGVTREGELVATLAPLLATPGL